MDDLSLLLVSKEFFLSLSSQKIKTLKQAIQLNNKTLHNSKIDDLMNQYEYHDRKVSECIKKQDKWWEAYKVPKFQENPLGYYLQNASIIQIIGHKGSGKTGILLKLGFDYLIKNKQKSIIIFNCAGGITAQRISRFKPFKYQYFDVFIIDELVQNLQKIKKEPSSGLIIIDNLINLFLNNEKIRFGLGQLIIALRDLGWSIYFTNYIQGKFQIDQKQLLNPTGYFSHVFGSLCSCKLLIEPSQQKDNHFKIRMIKSLNSKSYEYKALMNQYGLNELVLERHH